jgi:hypothetical protein
MKVTFTFAFLFVASVFCWGQDILVKRNGDEIKARVLTITPEEITYRLHGSQPDSLANSRTEMIARAELFMIKYENGAKEVFDGEKQSEVKLVSSVPAGEEVAVRKSSADLYNKGRFDATSYYRGYKGAATGTLVLSLISPLAGLIPAVACSATPPQEHNLQYPSYDQFRQLDYQNGYRNQARKTKSGRVWRNWGIGLGVNLALAIILAN